jgi:hypothetical protein
VEAREESHEGKERCREGEGELGRPADGPRVVVDELGRTEQLDRDRHPEVVEEHEDGNPDPRVEGAETAAADREMDREGAPREERRRGRTEEAADRPGEDQQEEHEARRAEDQCAG